MADKQHRAIMRLENTEENVNVPNPIPFLPLARRVSAPHARHKCFRFCCFPFVDASLARS